MTKSYLFVASASALGLCLGACGGEKAGGDGAPTGGGITATDGIGDGDGDDDDADDDDDGSGGADQGDDDDDDDDDDDPQTYFDVGAGGDLFCKYKDEGIYCDDDNFAIQCGDMGNVVADTNCVPGACLENVGCVTCLQGQYSCSGPHVMQCTAANAWQILETCDPAAGQGCDLSQPMPTCAPLAPLGTTEPTGVYYQYAYFASGGVFQGGYDVDSFENRLYINRGTSVDVYEVELLDSDGDGVFEPNQHPDNPDDMGPIEERVLTFIENIAWPSSKGQSVSEIYVNDVGMWIGGSNVEEMLWAGGGGTTILHNPPGWANTFAQIGFDDVNEVWYASNEQNRRVFQQHPPTNEWGIAFYYPSLAGDHMDGLEVVTQPETGIPYVYVSDMTSDFIGQYRLDANLGWIQENLFEYEGTAGQAVEGMGFGVLNHFWATSGGAVYEVGGGDLAEFTEPPG